MIALYILAWALCGVASCYLEWKYHSEELLNSTLTDLIICMVCGAIGLILILPCVPAFKNLVVFKARK